MKRSNLLLVDDDKNFLRVLSYHIQELGFRTVTSSSASEALELIKQESFDLAITDLKMPEMDGLQLLAELKKSYPDLPVIVLTAYGSIDGAVQAIKGGAYDYLSKPFEKEEIQHAITNALKMSDLIEENRRLSKAISKKFEFSGFIGQSKKFKEVLDLAEQVAGVDTTVLIEGESGTGKEIMARAIHFNSTRRNRPFVIVNCGAIPKELMESELFGYKKGAFTGALSNRKGKFEVADSGTLFLDEAGELPLEMQVKLLRVLQEREIDVVGDPHPRPVNIRILAATNQDLHQRMKEGVFREDLYYRLSVAPLRLPPLRERREDIPLLAHYFIEKLEQRMSKKVLFDDKAIEALQTHDWPGNVRELENIVERLVVFDRRGIVKAEDLPGQFHSPILSTGKVSVQLPEEGFSLKELERDLLLAALELHNWNQTHAARYLGMTRNTLIYRMQKYKIKESNTKDRYTP